MNEKLSHADEAWRMNQAVISMNNEEAYFDSGWLYIWPDECRYAECVSIFSNEDSFKELEELYLEVVKAYYKDGWYITRTDIPLADVLSYITATLKKLRIKGELKETQQHLWTVVKNKSAESLEESKKMIHLISLIDELNAPIEIDGEQFDSEFKFEIKEEDGIIYLFDANENYSINYLEDQQYMYNDLISEFGGEMPSNDKLDTITPRIVGAIKADFGPNSYIEWEDNVRMIVVKDTEKNKKIADEKENKTSDNTEKHECPQCHKILGDDGRCYNAECDEYDPLSQYHEDLDANQDLMQKMLSSDVPFAIATDEDDKQFLIFYDWEDVRKIQKIIKPDFESSDENDTSILDGLQNVGWGFADEWAKCDECDKLIRTSPDSYSFKPDYWFSDKLGILCGDCVRNNHALEYAQSLINDAKKANTILSSEDLENLDFTLIDKDFESGWYDRHDSPEEILATALEKHPEGAFLFSITGQGQFATQFELWGADLEEKDEEEDDEHLVERPWGGKERIRLPSDYTHDDEDEEGPQLTTDDKAAGQWYEELEESLDEASKGRVETYKGYGIHDVGDSFVITDRHGTTVKETKVGLPIIRVMIDDMIKDLEKEGLIESVESTTNIKYVVESITWECSGKPEYASIVDENSYPIIVETNADATESDIIEELLAKDVTSNVTLDIEDGQDYEFDISSVDFHKQEITESKKRYVVNMTGVTKREEQDYGITGIVLPYLFDAEDEKDARRQAKAFDPRKRILSVELKENFGDDDLFTNSGEDDLSDFQNNMRDDDSDDDSETEADSIQVYQFPNEMKNYLPELERLCEEHNLKFLGEGKNVIDNVAEPDFFIEGRYADLVAFADELDYELHPDYLCHADEFAYDDILIDKNNSIEESTQKQVDNQRDLFNKKTSGRSSKDWTKDELVEFRELSARDMMISILVYSAETTFDDKQFDDLFEREIKNRYLGDFLKTSNGIYPAISKERLKELWNDMVNDFKNATVSDAGQDSEGASYKQIKYANESLKESVDDNKKFTDEDVNKFVKELTQKFFDDGGYYDLWTHDGQIIAQIEWGDWKHDHMYFKSVVQKYFDELGIKIEIESETTDEDDSDTYSAQHTITLLGGSK